MKKYILDRLKQKNEYVSGEELSRVFGVSRTAVWKHINELRKDGYNIESSSKKGYRLIEAPDILDERELKIPEGQLIGCKVIHFDEIDSTNTYAKKIAYEGCPHGTVVIAERQLSGRGRVGREWKSDNPEGLWFSIVLRPDMEPEQAQLITLAASVAVVEAISETAGIICGIKWPNDIILNSCKLGGILTELSAELGHINYVVVGIGININHNTGTFDDEIKKTAISLKQDANRDFSRVEILSSLMTGFESIYNLLIAGNTNEIISRWNRSSVTLGKEIRITAKNVEYIGIAESITANGRLIVRCNDGETREISAGEIQVRGLLGYT